MNLARVTGTVVCVEKLPGFTGEKFLVLQPLDENLKPAGTSLVATDITGAGPDEIVFYETGREAAVALEASWNVSDATVMGIVDRVDSSVLEPEDEASR